MGVTVKSFHSRLISLTTNMEEQVFVVTCKTKGLRCEKIKDHFERKLHKKRPTDKAICELLAKVFRIVRKLDLCMIIAELITLSFVETVMVAICGTNSLRHILLNK